MAKNAARRPQESACLVRQYRLDALKITSDECCALTSINLQPTENSNYSKVASQSAMARISSSETRCMMPFMAAVWPLLRAPLVMSFIWLYA